MRLRNEARVGLIVFSGIVVLIGVYWFLGGLGLRTSSYPIHAIFPQAQKLNRGADVRMAGVRIGVVSDIRLTRRSRARVDMLIWNGNRIPCDSIARITTGGLIGDSYVELVPGERSRNLRAGRKIQSTQVAGFDQIMMDASSMLQEMKRSASSFNDILGDPKVLATVKDSIASLNRAAEQAAGLIQAGRQMISNMSPQVDRVFVNLTEATGEVAKIAKQIEDMIAKDTRPNMKAVMEQACKVATNLNDAVVQARQLIGSMKEASGRVDSTLGKVDNTATQAEQMMTKLNEASGGLRDIATDKELQDNLKAAVKNAAIAAEQAKQLMGELNQKFGRQRCSTPVSKSAIPEHGVSTNSLWNTDQGKYRFDANYTFSQNGETFYRAGAYNIGENTRLNLQGGRLLDYNNAFRYGLYASRVGLGYDRRVGQSGLISADLFRPNDPEMELRGVWKIGDSVGIYAGTVDLLHENRRDVLLGIRYQR